MLPMTGRVVIAGLMLAMTLPCVAQRPDHNQAPHQRMETRRQEAARAQRWESPRGQRQDRSFRQNTVRPTREFRQPARQQPPNLRSMTPQGSRSYSRMEQQREVAQPPSRRAAPSYSMQQPRREVPRPPSQSQPRSPGPASSYAQEQRREVAHPPSQGQPRQPNQGPTDAQRPREVPRPPQSTNPQAREVPRPPQRHGGDWLRSHRELSPSDQQKALLNDPQFRKLPAPQQQRLENRLQHFNSLPADEQQRRLNRIETWEHLTPQQKQQARTLAGQWKGLAPERKQMMKTAIGDLRAMPPDQRDRVLESPRFRSMFSGQERDMLRETTKLPLAPAQPPPQQ